MNLRTQKLILLVSLGWLTVIATGFWVIWRHENSPGPAGRPPAVWPVDSGIKRSPGVAALIVLAHPKCPCARASIGELAVLMARSGGRVQAHVLFYQPGGADERWSRTDVWNSAASIPGVVVREDRDGVEARRFGAETSGQTMLYDVSGKLLFSGGITGSRAHAGDNAGRDAIILLLWGAVPDDSRAAVFGCSLFDRQCAGRKEVNQ